MKQQGFSRRNFVSIGSVFAASAFASSVSGQTPGIPEAKSRSMFNAMDFGAKGDGTTDDTQAIQKAMDKAAFSNGAVLIPEGNYLCSELKVPEGIGLHGLPAWSYRKGMGNAMNSGRDDEGKGSYSPDYGIVMKGLENSVIKDNVQHNGALKQLVVDRGEHGEGVIIKDNVGSLRKIG